MRTLPLVAAFAVGISSALAQDASLARDSARADPQTEHAFSGRVVLPVAADYLLYLPEGYEEGDAAWPLVLFLHGAGERGDSLALLKRHGPPKLIAQGEPLPFIVVSPQQAAGGWWNPYVLDALLDEVIATHRVNEDRVYVTGLSMGGFGTWGLAALNPDRFAAAAPICGGGTPRLACNAGRLPVWAFHGADDPVVPLESSEVMVDALAACGGDVRLTIYPGVGHDSWTRTYDDPRFFDWLLGHRRSDRD
jgi:predicted peptidase